MHSITTFCPFCRSTLFVGAERCSSCGATIEYGRIPLRYFFLLVVLLWLIIGGVHLFCDDIGIMDFIVQLSIATTLSLVVWGWVIRKLRKKYTGRIRFTR